MQGTSRTVTARLKLPHELPEFCCAEMAALFQVPEGQQPKTYQIIAGSVIECEGSSCLSCGSSLGPSRVAITVDGRVISYESIEIDEGSLC
jgi:hypothetical protein